MLVRPRAGSVTLPAYSTAIRQDCVCIPHGAPIPLWESMWTTEPPRLMGPAHTDALRHYAAAGWVPGGGEPADHIALELGFVARLAAAGRREEFIAFWRSHVTGWMPAFARKLRGAARIPLYTAAGELLLAAVTPVRRRDRPDSPREPS